MTFDSELKFPNWLDSAARSHPDKLALTFGSEQWSFNELRESVEAATSVLNRARGGHGGRIGILSANRPGFVFAVHAATSLGVPFVPLNWRQSDDELAWQVRDAGITVLAVDEQRASYAATACAGLPVTIMHIAELERLPDLNAAPNTGRHIDLNGEAAVVFTSGTSGRPKGARITYGNLWFSAVASAMHIGHRLDDIWLAAMPLFHIGGLAILFRGVIGATPVMLRQRFDPADTLMAIESGATLVSVVPTMLQRMLDLERLTGWPASLRHVLLGGSAAPPRLVEECLRRGIPVAPTYGLTEAASQVTTLLPTQAITRPSSSGLPLSLTEVRITGVNGSVAPGEIGEIEIRGPTLFAGYLGATETPGGRTSDGWFATGDAGYLDDDGYLYLVDRRDDLIISGGENVYPAEIERVLREHPSVIDAGVVGIEDDVWGKRPAAAVVWNADSATTIDELRQFCAERLAGFKIPDRFLLFAELPRTPSGKLLRGILRERILEPGDDTATPV